MKVLKISWLRDGYLEVCGTRGPKQGKDYDSAFIETPVTFEKIGELVGLSDKELRSFVQNKAIEAKKELEISDLIWVVSSPHNEDDILLAKLAYAEAFPLNINDKYAVASTVINRIKHKKQYKEKSSYADTVKGVIMQKTTDGKYEYNAVHGKKWEKAGDPNKLLNIKDVKDWNYSVKAVELLRTRGPFSSINGATIFYNGKDPKDNMVDTSVWKIKYIYTVPGGHSYFSITPNPKSK